MKVGSWGESVGWVSELGEPQMEGMDADGGVLGGVLVGRGGEKHGLYGWAGVGGAGMRVGRGGGGGGKGCVLYTSPSRVDRSRARMASSGWERKGGV